MAERILTFEDWKKLSEKEKGERYKELSDKDKFRIRISMNPGVHSMRCNSCQHYFGNAKCIAFPNGIPKKHMNNVDQNISVSCGNNLCYKEKY